jgi:membrane-bound ClpP family serine protease
VITFSLGLVATGVLGLLDLGGLSVPFPAYLAVALAVVGLGMILGTWLGRARGLIGLGLLLAALLGISTLTGHVSGGVHGGVGEVHWTPTTYADVASEYSHGIGDATLDLSAVDFTGQDKTINVRANIGDTTIILPANVDVVVNARIDAGNAEVFGQNWDGVNTQQHTITDLGADGTGGGHLVLNVHVNTGHLEVMR